MARKSEEERYQKWIDRIKEREAFLKAKIQDWNRYMRLYRMALSHEETLNASGSGGDTVWLNYHFALSRIILPSVYFRNPDVLVSPLRGTPLTYCVLLEKLINKQLTDIDFDLEMRKVIFDTLFCGIGIMKFGYAPALTGTTAKTTQDEFADVAMTLFEEDLWENPKGVSSKTDIIEIDQRIPKTAPFGIRISPRYWLFDPMAATDKEGRWMVHKILKPVDDLKKSKIYPRGLTSGIEGNISLRDAAALNEVPGGYASMQAGYTKTHADFVYVYEVWDRETDKLLVLDSYNMDQGTKKFIREEDNPYDIDGFPFEVLCFNPDPETPYGIPDAETWENPTNALNLLNTMQYEHAKRALPKTLARKSILSPEEMAKMTSPRLDAVVEVDGEISDVGPLQMGTMGPDLYGLRDVLRNELTFITGVTEQRKGGSQKSQTATEASIIEQQSRIRDSDRLSAVSKFVTRAARKILMLDRQFLEPNEIAFVVGPEAMSFWQEAGPDVVKAEVDIRVRVGSSAFMSREVRAKQLLDFLNLTSGLMDPMTGGPLVDVKEVVRRVAEALDIEDFERLLITPPTAPGVLPMMAGASSPGMAGQGGQGGPQQSMARRGGGTNLGDQLSGVQNLGVRRAPNPTDQGAPV